MYIMGDFDFSDEYMTKEEREEALDGLYDELINNCHPPIIGTQVDDHIVEIMCDLLNTYCTMDIHQLVHKYIVEGLIKDSENPNAPLSLRIWARIYNESHKKSLNYRGAQWPRISKAIKESYCHDYCHVCGKTKNDNVKLETHHIIPFDKFDDPNMANVTDNLVVVCHPCHEQLEKLFDIYEYIYEKVDSDLSINAADNAYIRAIQKMRKEYGV